MRKNSWKAFIHRFDLCLAAESRRLSMAVPARKRYSIMQEAALADGGRMLMAD
jgi:hypothetical protein